MKAKPAAPRMLLKSLSGMVVVAARVPGVAWISYAVPSGSSSRPLSFFGGAWRFSSLVRVSWTPLEIARAGCGAALAMTV